jgi:hypothetical protein
VIILAQNTAADGLQAGPGAVVADVIGFLPRLLAFIAILVVGYAVARLLQRALASVFERLGVSRALARGGISDALARADIDVGRLLSRLVFYGLLLLVLQLAFGVFGPNPVSDLLQRLIAFIPRVIVALVLVVVAAAVARAVRDVVAALIGGLPYGRALAVAAQLLILGIGVFAALDQLAIAPTIVTGLFYALLAMIVGIAVVAVGGGGIAPMRQRWERALTRVDAEAARMRDEARRQREAEEEARRQAEAEEEARRQQETEDLTIRSTPPPSAVPPPSPDRERSAERAGDRPEASDDETLPFDPELTTPIPRPPADEDTHPTRRRGRQRRRRDDD